MVVYVRGTWCMDLMHKGLGRHVRVHGTVVHSGVWVVEFIGEPGSGVFLFKITDRKHRRSSYVNGLQ